MQDYSISIPRSVCGSYFPMQNFGHCCEISTLAMQTDTHEALDSYVVGPRGRIRRPRTGGRTRKKPGNQIRLHPRLAPPDGRDPLRCIRRRGGETRGGALRRRRGGRNGPTPAGDLRDRRNRPGGNRRDRSEAAPLIRRLSEAGKIDTAPLEGAWERYLIQTVAIPCRASAKPSSSRAATAAARPTGSSRSRS